MLFDVIQDVGSLASLPNINVSLQVSLIKHYFAGVFAVCNVVNGSKSRNKSPLTSFRFFPWALLSPGLGVKTLKI